MLAYTFIGTTDEVTTCGCCGRSDLKGTIVLQAADGGDFVFFGSVCGARAQGWTVKDFNKAAKTAEQARKHAALMQQYEVTRRVQQHPDVIVAAAAIPMAGSGKTWAERYPFIQARIEVENRVRKEIEAALNA